MKRKLIALSRRYVTALQIYLLQPRGGLRPALAVGRLAVACGLETLELARIHEQALARLKLSNGERSLLKQAEDFFSEALTPIIATHHSARQSKLDLNRLTETLKRRTTELAATNRELQRDIGHRISVEAALKKSSTHYTKLLSKSLQLQEGLRQLTHQVLAAQEDERKNISRDLQNEIAQTLLGINVQLISLKREARGNTKGLKQQISNTQRLVIESARFVRRVARKISSL